eukprot:TRINITY_DN44128_c0_g1_i1.p1 TRINITY_DN44128_c0_g1~~TRINITY_DN44128_c0_g1_i1.p1  ORF type:complete len:283 (-),score=80.74 TRINITY_DN44128_c0_g1_i1:589-1437(-)
MSSPAAARLAQAEQSQQQTQSTKAPLPPSQELHDERVVKQLTKTRLCAFFTQKVCRNGASCSFAHGVEELTAKPDLRKTSICKAWEKGACPHAPADCHFAHGYQQIRVSKGFVPEPSRGGGASEVIGSGKRQQKKAIKQSQALLPGADGSPFQSDDMDAFEVSSETSTVGSTQKYLMSTPSGDSPCVKTFTMVAEAIASQTTQCVPVVESLKEMKIVASPLESFLAFSTGTGKSDKSPSSFPLCMTAGHQVDVPLTLSVIVAADPQYYEGVLRQAMPVVYED